MIYRSILLLFLVSGAFGLGYQVLWSKFLLDFIGVSAYSYATVLAAFMGGLALGSVWLGRVADRMRSPLRLYAILEFGVGLYAIAYLPIMKLTASIYGSLVQFTPEQAGDQFGLGAKVLVSGLLLLPPTILLGGTFPAMVRHVTVNLHVLGRRASTLYALNAAGAVVGTLAIAFVVLPGLGMRGSLIALACGNILVAAVAWFLADRRVEGEDESPASTAPTIGPQAVASATATAPAAAASTTTTATSLGDDTLSPGLVRMLLLFIGLEGMLSFVYEIAWTRYFGLVLGSSTYSFATMLAAFITGISLGGAIFAAIERRVRRPLVFFGWTQLAVGVLVLLPLQLYPYLPWVFSEYRSLFSNEPGAFYPFEIGKLLLCFLFMLPPTTLIGMAIPIVVKGLASDLGKLGRDTGRIYAWNTWGGVTGSLAAGLLLLPMLGMEWMLRLSALGNTLLGLAILSVFLRGPLRSRALPLGLSYGVIAIVLVMQLLGGGWNNAWFSLIRFRADGTEKTFEAAKARVNSYDVIVFEDDPAANLMVTRNMRQDGPSYTLYVNGKPDASSGTDLPTQILSGHFPIVLHPEAEDVLIIGMASGITAGASLLHDIRRLDVVELIRAMPLATQAFATWNLRPEQDPRCVMIFDDARSYLSYTTQEYDIIISEPSNPWMAGTGALFTRDFYEKAKDALREDGIYLQWIQLYELSDEALASMLRSFRVSFPWIYGFQGNNADLLLLGSRQALTPDWERLEKLIANPQVREQLASINITDLSSFLYLQRFGPGTSDYIASITDRYNTDDNHYLEYQAPRDLFAGEIPRLPFAMDDRLYGSSSLLWNDWRRENDIADEAIDADAIMRTLADNRIVLPPVNQAFKLAMYEAKSIDVDTLEGDDWLIYRDPLAYREVQDADSFAARVEALLGRGDAGAVLQVIDSYRSAMLTQIALSDSAGTRFLAKTDAWLARDTDPVTRAVLAELKIDQLLAANRQDEAMEVLLGECRNPTGLAAQRLLERASRFDPTVDLGPAIDALLRRGDEPMVRRYQELRSSRRESR